MVECLVTIDGREEQCAVKLLKPALFDSNQDVTDFIKEGVVLRKIKHPCVECGLDFHPMLTQTQS